MLTKLRAFVSGDRLLAVLFLAVTLVYGWEAAQMRPELAADVVGPGLFPKALAILGFVLAVIHLARPPESRPLTGQALRKELAALKPLALLLLYVFGMEWIGFPVSTAAFLALMFKYLGERRWRTAVFGAMLVTAVIVVFFQVIFGVALPRGALMPRLW